MLHVRVSAGAADGVQVGMTRRAMAAGYDVVVWMDDDAFIAQPDKTVEVGAAVYVGHAPAPCAAPSRTSMARAG